MRAPSAILFDMDGVLVKSEEVWARLVEEAGRRFRGSPVTRAEFAPTFGQGSHADVEVFGLRCTPAELDAFYARSFGLHAEHVWTNPEAAPLLQWLRRCGLKLAVVTNTTTPLAREILEASRLWDLFDFVGCADQVAHPKPAPDLLHFALGQLATRAGSAWMVGDSRYDLGAAEAAGVPFVGLGLEAPRRIDRLGELEGLVARALAA